MSGLASRDKGKRGERELAAFLREHGFTDARRGVQYHGGPESPDVTPCIPGVHIECKRAERINLHSALAQAQSDAKPGETGIVFHRRNRGEWVAILDAAALLDVLRRIGGVM